MGLLIQKETFDEDDFVRFSARLRESIEALETLLGRPGFGVGKTTIGSELELFLVDEARRPLPLNRAVLAETMDPRLTVEIDRFNLECNTRPCPLAGRPFSALAGELESALAEVMRAAEKHGGAVATIGILPTLRREDLVAAEMTDLPRYRVLAANLRRLRQGPFHLRIHGREPIELYTDDVALEGAGTSFQLHLRVDPDKFADTYNAAQLATLPALAVAGNSPILLGHELWEETRIALFKQAVDDRGEVPMPWRPASRVSFGYGWARRGAAELFAESVALHAPLLPVISAEDPLDVLRAGGVPKLEELRLHHGTVWRWNRAVYDPAGGGHLRIELRALPAGPTIADMIANAAFALGLTLGLSSKMERMIPGLPFEHAHHGFYRAAQKGLDATLLWPAETPPSPHAVKARDLVRELVPVAMQGLLEAGVDEGHAGECLRIIAARVDNGQTGSKWQRRQLEAYEKRMPREEALGAMLATYMENSASGRPVHEWPVRA